MIEDSEGVWPTRRLSEVTDPEAPIVYGILQAGPNIEGGVPYVRPSEMHDDRINVQNLLRTSAEIAARYDRSALKQRDILLSIVGTIGKVAIVPAELEGGNINQSAVRIRVQLDVFLPEFLAWLLRSPYARRQYEKSIFGSAVMRLNVAHVRALEVPIPPLQVQHELVMDIENRLTRLRAGRDLLQGAEANLRLYRASIFKAGCEGRLVASEADLAAREGKIFVDAEALLASTARPPSPARNKRKSRDIIPGHSALAVGNPKTALPKGWAWVSLTDVAQMESGHTPSRSVAAWWNGSIPWLSLTDARMHDGGRIDDTTQHTNELGLANSSARLLPAGTVAVSRTAAIGYVVILGRPMATSQDFVNWIPTRAVSSQWLQVVFSAEKKALQNFGKGSIHQTIYFPELLALHIALPPRAEQDRICAEIDRQTASIQALQRSLTKSQHQGVLLRDSILAAAFGDGDRDDRRRPRPLRSPPSIEPEFGPVMPTRKRIGVRPEPLMPVIKAHAEGITVEQLFQVSGYFEAGDPDGFYQELSRHRDEIQEVRPVNSATWPDMASVKLKIRCTSNAN